MIANYLTLTVAKVLYFSSFDKTPLRLIGGVAFLLHPVVGKQVLPGELAPELEEFPTKLLNPVAGKRQARGYQSFIQGQRFPTKRLNPVAGKFQP